MLLEDSILLENSAYAGDLTPENYASVEEVSKMYPILDGPTESILERLQQVDPVMANRWHPNDRRKIRRSLEIYLSTGRRASEIYEMQGRFRAGELQPRPGTTSKLPMPQPGNDEKQTIGTFESSVTDNDQHRNGPANSPLIFWCYADTDVLKARLDDRVDEMVRSGLIDEVRSLADYLDVQTSNGIQVDQTRGIWVSIGFKEFEKYLSALKSTTSDEELEALRKTAIEQTKAATRQYARRQSTWIRIKLFNALAKSKMSDRLFLLDCSDVGKWSKMVTTPATEITSAFLKGECLPSPGSLSAAAETVLSAKSENSGEGQGSWVQRKCEYCGTVGVNEQDWTRHIKGHRHQRAVKRSTRPRRRPRSEADLEEAKSS